MEEFIEIYSKWFPYCDKEKLKEEMRQDLSAMANCNLSECDEYEKAEVCQHELEPVKGWLHKCILCDYAEFEKD